MTHKVFRDGPGVDAVLLHADFQGFQPPEDEPTFKGSQHGTRCILMEFPGFVQFMVRSDDGPAYHIRVSAHVFRHAVHDGMGSQFQGAL